MLYNQDGSVANMCGNGIRTLACYYVGHNLNESDVFTNDEGVVFTLVGTVEVALKCECTNDEGLVYLANVSEENEVRDIILDHNKNMLGFDKNGRLIMIQDGYGNTIQVVYGTLNDRNKIIRTRRKRFSCRFC